MFEKKPELKPINLDEFLKIIERAEDPQDPPATEGEAGEGEPARLPSPAAQSIGGQARRF